MSGISKRVSGSWVSGDYGIMETSTDTITTLPAVIYANDTTATVGLKGNMSQTGTPTPQNPIQPSECGDLETVGEKAGQYKIPISSANTTTPVYLGEVETTRRIKKLVLTGEETWAYESAYTRLYTVFPNSLLLGIRATPAFCTHFQVISDGRPLADVPYNSMYSNSVNMQWFFKNTDYTTVDAWKSYLADQYANGTPVTVWYVLAEPETGIVNEPLMKIGEYADTLSGISIPVTAGGDTISVDTTLQPSEVTVNYKGWHPVQSVHERENGAWT